MVHGIMLDPKWVRPATVATTVLPGLAITEILLELFIRYVDLCLVQSRAAIGSHHRVGGS